MKFPCRPGLLLESIFRHVPAARDELAALFPQTDIDHMVQVRLESHCNCIRLVSDTSAVLTSGITMIHRSNLCC